MQCFESAEPVKAAWHDVKCTVKEKLDFVNATFQNLKKNMLACKKPQN